MREELAAALDIDISEPEQAIADVATDAQVEAVTETEAPAVEALEPPARFSAAERETFTKLPREAQEIVLARHKEMEADYTRKTMELAEQRKPLDEYSSIFEPYRQQMELAGTTPAQVTRQLLAALNVIEMNPAEGLKWLAQSYKVDLSSLVPKDEAFVDPALKELRDEIASLKNERQRETQQVQTQNVQVIQKQINDFKDAKNEDGSVKYPHFDKVKAIMAPLVNEGKSLAEAYDIAKFTLPEEQARIRDEVAKTAIAEAAKKAEEGRKTKAKEVRGTTQIIRSRGTATEESGKAKTLREELAANLASQTGRI